LAQDPGDAVVNTTTTTFTTTTTTSFDVCSGADTACACASYPSCWWAQMANGNGRCQYVVGGNGGGVDCSLCPEQPFCVDSECSRISEPCTCANYPASCKWENPGPGSLASASCVGRSSFDSVGVACSDCSAQAYCQTTFPLVQTFEPAQGELLNPEQPILTMTFNMNMTWCQNANPEAFVWCDGSLENSWLPSSRLTLLGKTLQLEISEAILLFNRVRDRECGIVVPGGQLCDFDDWIGFHGVTRGSYSFLLPDNEAPRLVSFDPKPGDSEISADKPIKLIFNEPVVLGSRYLASGTAERTGTLNRFSEDDSGYYVSHTTMFPIASPELTVDGSDVYLNLQSSFTYGAMHTISLPPGALLDTKGNAFQGLATDVYTFRVSVAPVVRQGTAEGGANVVLIVVIVMGIALCVLGAAIGARYMLLAKLSKKWAYMDEEMGLAKKPAVILRQKTVASKTTTEPDCDSGESGSTWGFKPTQGSSARVHPSADYPAYIHREASKESSGAPQQEQPSYRGQGPGSFASGWNGKPSQDAPVKNTSAPSISKPPRGRTGGAPQPRPSAGPSQGWGAPPSSAPPASAHNSNNANASPRPQQEQKRSSSKPRESQASAQPNSKVPLAAQAIERQLQDNMNEPIAVRKKLLKGLQLEYHPDKNSDPTATEVFQYINNAKGWFLHDG